MIVKTKNDKETEAQFVKALDSLLLKTKKDDYKKIKTFIVQFHKQKDLSLFQPPLITDEPVDQDVEDTLYLYLQGQSPMGRFSALTLLTAFEWILVHRPENLILLMKNHLKDRKATSAWIELLPDRLLTRLIYFFQPVYYSPVQRYADTITLACSTKAVIDRPENLQNLKWTFLFQYMAEESAFHPFDEKMFIRRFVDFLAESTKSDDRESFYLQVSQQLEAAVQHSAKNEHLTIIKVISDMVSVPFDREISERSEKPYEAEKQTNNYKTQDTYEEEEQDYLEEVYILNAGIVLASPYLPRLFKILGFIEESKFKTSKLAERAVHLLEFMVNENTDSPEYKLVLNKILCGVKTGIPLQRSIEITDDEKTALEGLIKGMIQNWKIIGNTSVQGFRESFLQRQGRLLLKDNAWHLHVQQRAFDMLLDKIPWSFSTVKMPWMEKVLYVKWKNR